MTAFPRPAPGIAVLLAAVVRIRVRSSCPNPQAASPPVSFEEPDRAADHVLLVQVDAVRVAFVEVHLERRTCPLQPTSDIERVQHARAPIVGA